MSGIPDRANQVKGVFILAFKVARLGFEVGQSVGSFLGTIGELEGELLCTAKHIRQLQTENLGHKDRPCTHVRAVRELIYWTAYLSRVCVCVCVCSLTMLPSLLPTMVL